jgi:hypothetical protein
MIVRVVLHLFSPLVPDPFGHADQDQTHGEASGFPDQDAYLPRFSNVFRQDAPSFPGVPVSQGEVRAVQRTSHHGACDSSVPLHQTLEVRKAKKAEIGHAERSSRDRASLTWTVAMGVLRVSQPRAIQVPAQHAPTHGAIDPTLARPRMPSASFPHLGKLLRQTMMQRSSSMTA